MKDLRAWIKPGDWLALGLVLFPLALAWPRLATSADGGAAGWLALLGRGAGVLAFSTFLAAGILSVRLPRLDRFFGGLTRLWYVHHILGFCSFLLAMAHVLLMGFSALPASMEASILTVFPPLSSTAAWVGWLAFAAMLAFLAPTFKFFGYPRYQRWKRLHLVSAAALVLSLAHVLALSPEKTGWWLLAALCSAAMLWRKALSPLYGRFPYVITAVEPLARGVVELSLRPESRPFAYQPGQFFYLTPCGPALKAGRGEEHPYTVSSAPHEGVIRMGIKDLGDATHALQTVPEGTRVWLEGPYGVFLERRFPELPQLWLGGGIGIAPFVSGARNMRHEGAAPEGGVHLFYMAGERERAYYLDELLAAAAEVHGFRVTEHYYHRDRPMSAEFLAAHCPDFAEREIFICGPPAMVTHMRGVLSHCGVPRARIHREDFNLL